MERLPLTVRPSIYQQLDQWDMLFPFERKALIQFFCGLDSLSSAQLDTLTAPLRRIETEMGVSNWNFSVAVNTMENSGELARSAWYRAWRSAVQQLYSVIASQPCAEAEEQPRGRVIVSVLPASLPVSPEAAWGPWSADGRLLRIQGSTSQLCERLLHDLPEHGSPNQNSGDAAADTWWIDAGTLSGDPDSPQAPDLVSCLSYARLDPFRKEFLAELNSIPRDTHVASETLVALQHRDWSHWWPPELRGQDRLRNFVVNLYLTGNGSLIFSNAFVEWAASEALRRARPRLLVARFGVRPRPRPFTGIAIFEDQTRVSTLPEVPDPAGSAIDAALLARYVWLAALRYPEYGQALGLCIAEHLNAAWIAGPAASRVAGQQDSLTPDDLYNGIARILHT